jgi:cAMP-dependent protein kinase regulator
MEDIPQSKLQSKKGHSTVSAEAYGKWNKKEDFKPKVITKSSDQKQRIIKILEKAFMFSALDTKERNIIIDAMEERSFK